MTFVSRRRLMALTTIALSGALVLPAAVSAQTEITLMGHGAGNPDELEILEMINADFAAAQDDWVIVMEQYPQDSYNETVRAAALAGELACLVDVDGPNVPEWAWSGFLQPLALSEGAVDEFLPTTLGYWQDQLYSVGFWEAAKAIFARKSDLEKYGIRMPTIEEPWTGE